MNQQLKARTFQFDAPVNALAFSLDSAAFAFGLGDGKIHLVNGDTRTTLQAHTGAVPKIVAYDEGFLSLSDDGTCKKIRLSGDIQDFADFKGVWTEKMDVHANGSIAVAVGKSVHLWTRLESTPKILGPHDSTINDVYFAPDGLGLVAAHRDGVTLWAWPHFEATPKHLPWKGAHLAVTTSANKRWVISAMQEGALHLWNLGLKRDFQMQGYWAKPTCMAWSADQKLLGTSGAESVVLWPFDKAGPEGREPIQLGWSNGSFVSALVSHPEHNIMAAGFEDGAVLLIDVDQGKAFSAAASSGHAITALRFASDGASLLAGSANGGAVHFSL